jgi:hypothetical protein
MFTQSDSTVPVSPLLKLNDAAFDLSNGQVLNEVGTKELSNWMC